MTPDEWTRLIISDIQPWWGPNVKWRDAPELAGRVVNIPVKFARQAVDHYAREGSRTPPSPSEVIQTATRLARAAGSTADLPHTHRWSIDTEHGLDCWWRSDCEPDACARPAGERGTSCVQCGETRNWPAGSLKTATEWARDNE